MLNGLDLFSGIGGMSIALNEWVRPIGYCEIDTYCQAVLFSRMADKSIDNAPIWDDIRTLPGSDFVGAVDIIYGGFPCQDISVAGMGKGLEGERSGLFFEIIRLVKEIRPRFVFLENVSAIRKRGLDTILKVFTETGYDCRWIMLRASAVGAQHKRERWFLLAHSNSKPSWKANTTPKPDESSKETRLRSTRQDRRDFPFVHWDEGKCPSLAMDDGFPFELDQARALGNAVVPEQAKKAFKILTGIK